MSTQVVARNIREEQPLVGSGDSTAEYTGYSITKNRYQLSPIGASVGTVSISYTLGGGTYLPIKDSEGNDFAFDLSSKDAIVFDASLTGLKAVGSGVTGTWEIKVISSVI